MEKGGGNDVKFPGYALPLFIFFHNDKFIFLIVGGWTIAREEKETGLILFFIYSVCCCFPPSIPETLVSNFFCFLLKRIWIYLKCEARFALKDKHFSNSYYAKFGLNDPKWKYRLISARNVFVLFCFLLGNWKVVKSADCIETCTGGRTDKKWQGKKKKGARNI